VKTIEALLEEALAPHRNRPQRAVEAAGDLRVRLPLSGEQHELRPQHLAVRHRVAGRPRAQLARLLLRQLDLERAPCHHSEPFRRRGRPSFNKIVRVLTAGSTKSGRNVAAETQNGPIKMLP